MTAPHTEGRPRLITGASLSRVVAFSDGIVAVAITVLVLPVVTLTVPANATSPFAVITENWPPIQAFLITFIIVFILWQGHHRVFDNFTAIDSPIMWLNGLWLLTIALLPWPSRLLDTTGSNEAVWLYCAVLFANAVVLHLIYQHGRSHPSLLKDAELWGSWLSVSLAFAALFAILMIVAFIAPQIAVWGLWVLVPLRVLIQQDGRLRTIFYDTSGRA